MKTITLATICLALFGCQTKPDPKIKALENKVDSLTYANEIIQKELNRYQIGYMIFVDRNPKGADQLGNIMSDETY